MTRQTFDENRYRADGWAVSQGYATPADLRALQNVATDLIQNVTAHPTCQYYFDRFATGETRLARVERITDGIPGFGETDLGQRMAQDARRLLGGDVVLFKDKLNIRYPNSKGYAPHQDAARWSAIADQFLSIGVFLSASSPDRGGFEFAECDPQRALLDNQRGDLNQDAYALLPRRAVTADAGDALVIDGFAPHCTTSNQSKDTILHVLFTYALANDDTVRDAYYQKMATDFERVRDGNRFVFTAR